MSSGRARFAEVVRGPDIDLGLACALIAVEAAPHHDPDATVDALDTLARQVPRAGEPYRRLHEVLGGFRGQDDDYRLLAASLLPDVLARRRGLPILLSVVWLEVARRVGVPAHGIGLPGHFVVGLGEPGAPDPVVDPFGSGVRLSDDDLRRLVRAGGGSLVPGSLRPWSPAEILQRILGNIRAWAVGPDRLPTLRWALELTLLLPSHPLDARRELGLARIRQGEYAGGADELDRYAEVVALTDPELADAVRRQARSARARLN